MKQSKCQFFSKEIQYLGHILSTKGINPLPSKHRLFKDAPNNNSQTSTCIPGIGRLLQKIYQKFHEESKAVNLNSQGNK